MICNSLHFNIFGQKSIPGGVIALNLLLAVYYPWTWPRGPGRHLIPIQFYMLSNFCVNKNAQKSNPGFLLSSCSWLSMALYLAQMVLEVRMSLKPTQFYIMYIFCHNNFPKISSPGGVLALGLLLAMYGPGLGPDGPGGPENP